MSRNKFATNSERGQVLLVACLFMTVLLGFTAMAIDVGLFFKDRRHDQNAADAAALAGSQELPLNPGAARIRARDWALNHGITNSEIKSINITSTSFPNDTISVQLEQEFAWIFGRVLGKVVDPVGADAAARVGSLAGGHQMMPWALLQGDSNCLTSEGDAITGATCYVKVGADSIVSGWRGALDFDGTGGGSAEYKSNIVDGTTNWKYCIDGEAIGGCVSSVSIIDALDGNKVGPTGSGIEERWATGAKCDANGNSKDDFNEVFVPNPGGTPQYTVNCPDSPWLVIIPIVSYSETPVKTVTIEGWSLAYLNTYSCVSGSTAAGTSGPVVLASGELPIAASWERDTVTPTPGGHPSAAVLGVNARPKTPTPTAAPSPPPGGSGVCGGTGHWQVQVNIVDAAYSSSGGFMGAYNPTSGITLRRLVQ